MRPDSKRKSIKDRYPFCVGGTISTMPSRPVEYDKALAASLQEAWLKQMSESKLIAPPTITGNRFRSRLGFDIHWISRGDLLVQQGLSTSYLSIEERRAQVPFSYHARMFIAVPDEAPERLSEWIETKQAEAAKAPAIRIGVYDIKDGSILKREAGAKLPSANLGLMLDIQSSDQAALLRFVNEAMLDEPYRLKLPAAAPDISRG